MTEQLFTEADEEGRGLLDAHGLLDICAMVGLKVTWDELERLLFHADCSVDGSVDLEEFVRFIESPDASLAMLKPNDTHNCSPARVQGRLVLPDGVTNSETLLGMLRDMSQQSRRHQLLCEFVQSDEQTGPLTVAELCTVLQTNGLPISLSQVMTKHHHCIHL